MNNEIKEYPKEQQKLKDYLDNVTIEQIIDKLKDDDGMTWWVDYQDQYQPNWKKIYVKEVQLLLDYITNLQEENERLKKELQQEKKDFKEANDYCFELKDYKSRNEKAVEFIKNTPLYEIIYDYNMEDELEIQYVSDETASNKLLNILNGRSDE